MRVHYSEEEKIRLRKLVIAYKSIIGNKKTDSNSNLEKKEVWEKITEQHNCSGRHPPRTTAQLNKLWANIKGRMKKNLEENKKHAWLEDDKHVLLVDNRGVSQLRGTAKMKKKGRFIFSEEEKIRLNNLFIAYKHIIENKKGDAVSLLQKKNAWDKITQQFNSGRHLPRRTAQLKKLWENIRYRMKTPKKYKRWTEDDDPNVAYISDNSQQDSMTVTVAPSTIEFKENLEDETLMTGQDEVVKVKHGDGELHELRLKEAQLKIAQLEKSTEHDEELFMLQKKKLLLEIRMLEVKLESGTKKLKNSRMCYTEL